ncbi:MAG: hypothetical protein IKO40_04450, partial [Kiritimatiellae bacterium]|nr:hypothetical protein [Kiritimatiellia bacterium]
MAAALICSEGALFAADTAYTQNLWKNPMNGVWNEDSNWSLDHVPTTSEEAVFPDASSDFTVTVSADTACARIILNEGSSKQTVSLAGSGKVTCSATDTTNYIRKNRTLALAGASLDLRSQLLNYGGLSVTQGSSYSCSTVTHLWTGSAWLTVAGDTTSFSSSSVQSRQAGNQIKLESGTFSAAVTYNSGSESSANPKLIINGGTLNGNVTLASTSSVTINGGTVTGNLTLSGNATFTMNGGKWTAPNTIASGAVADTVTLVLKGGHMISATGSRMTDKRWVQGDPGFKFTHSWVNSQAANLGAEVEVTSTFEVKGGLASTSATRYTGTGTIIARNLVTASGGAQTIAVPTLVLGAIADGNSLDTWVDKTDYKLVGPMTIGAIADWTAIRTGFRIPALRLVGDFTVDTTDYNDDTLGRVIILPRVNVIGKSTLTVTGRGVLRMSEDKNATPFERIVVRAGATFDPSFGATGACGPVQARQFVFEDGSHLALTAGNTWLMADALADSGADITVTIPSGLAEGWYPVIQGELGGTLPAALVASATIAGDSAGWSLVERDGTLFVKKVTAATAVATGSNDLEWTGGAETALWSSSDNWYGGAVPYYNNLYFGALGSGTNYYDSGVAAETVTCIKWLQTADSFTLKMTKPSNKFLTISNANATNTGADSGLYSLASTPQYVDIPIRFAVSLMSWCAAGRGPLVQCAKWISKNSPGQMVVQGDVRYRGNNGASSPVHILRLMDPYLNAPFTRFTVMKGGVMRVSTQIYPIDNGVSTTAYPTPASSIRVDEGGSLSFAGDASQYFGWTRKPAANIIDGTLALECPLAGGVDQTYTGRGTMLV